MSRKIIFTGERIIPDQVDDDLYNEHISRYLFAKRYLKGKVVLDAGCGVGYGAYEARKAAKKIYGIDISKESIEYAKRKYSSTNICFEVGDVKKLRFKDNFFDVILSFEVIEHLSRQDIYLEEMRRVLKKKGLFFVSTPNKIYYSKEGRPKNPFHTKEFNLKEFSGILSKQFKYVSIYNQNHNAVISISPQKQGTSTADIEICDASKISPIMDNYFIAVCSNAPIGKKTRKDFIYLPHKGNIIYERTKWARSLDEKLKRGAKYIEKLQKGFDEKAAWANNLNKELTITKKNAARLRKEFDEKAVWANSLNKELTIMKKNAARLRKEFDEKVAWANSINKELAESKGYAEGLRIGLDNKSLLVESLRKELDRIEELNAELDCEQCRIKKSLFYKVHLSFLFVSNNIHRLLARNRIVNSAASTVFLFVYFVFKNIFIPFRLNKAKSIAKKVFLDDAR